MPGPDQSASPKTCYAAFFHELTHWTGHASRLARPGITEPIWFGNGVKKIESRRGRHGVRKSSIFERAADFLTGVVRRSLLFRAASPSEILCSRWSLQNIALVLRGVRDHGRPYSLGTASQRDGCFRPPLASPADAGHARGWRLGIYRINLLLAVAVRYTKLSQWTAPLPWEGAERLEEVGEGGCFK